MLVLSRKIGEQIVVPDCEVAVIVLEVDGDRVRLGISAPTEIGVYREEVWRRIGPTSQVHRGPTRMAERRGSVDSESR